MNAVFTLAALTMAPVALAVASLLWGADSREGPDSPEWARREISRV